MLFIKEVARVKTVQQLIMKFRQLKYVNQIITHGKYSN